MDAHQGLAGTRPPSPLAALAIGLTAEALLLALVARVAPLTAWSWAAGLACALGVALALASALARQAPARLTAADAITWLRATFVAGVTALVAAGLAGAAAAPWLLVALATPALLLDAVDGKVARKWHCATPLGARFDMEVDAWLILVLSVHVARQAGAWVLLIGAARYLLAGAALALPWLRHEMPPRYWNKVVAATQGIVLTAACAQVLPLAASRILLIAAGALLAESFAHQVAWLWTHRPGQDNAACGAAPATIRPAAASRVAPIVAGIILWFALTLPDHTELLQPAAFLRLPIAWLAIAAFALLLPAAWRRAGATLAGLLAALVLLLHLLDMGFFQVFDRPFDPLTDWSYLGPALGLSRDSIGSVATTAIAAAALLAILTLLAVVPWAARRLTDAVAACPRGTAARVLGALTALWAACATAAISLPGAPAPIASHAALATLWQQAGAVRLGLADRTTFAHLIAHDPLGSGTNPARLAALRGKDVLLVFVESYGRVAIEGSSFAPGVNRVLADGTQALRAHGYAARSAYLVSPTFGGSSWFAHSTLESGLWVDSQQRYDQLLASRRSTLASLFRQAGWRAIADVPADTRNWPQGRLFYHFEKLWNARNVGYAGPRFSYATMPDQYTLAALQRLELAPSPRAPLFAEIDLVSSHHPWTPLPHMVPWSTVGDGHVYDSMPAQGLTPAQAAGQRATVRQLYGQSIEYSLTTLVSFLTTYPDPNRVLIVLGDHQPWEEVSGHDPGHDVPVSIISQDPHVLDRIASWGWTPGLRPAHDAPTWPMNTFRDRFLTAFTPPSP